MQPSLSPTKHLRLAAFWAVLGALGTLAVFPYLIALTQPTTLPPLPLPALALLSAIQSGILLFFLSWLGLRLGQPLGLDTPFARSLVYREPLPPLSPTALRFAIFSGSGGGAMLLLLAWLFQPLMPPMIQSTSLNIALWKRLLASFYGGITEELLLRLFLMTLITWIGWKLSVRTQAQPPNWVFWSAIVFASILFGVAHLPTAATVWALTPIVITRTLILNSLMGIAFGILYWQWGLEYAMLSHFCADLVLHGISGS